MPSTGFNYYTQERTSRGWEDCEEKLSFFKTEKEAIGHANQFVEKSISDGTPHNTAAVFGIDSDGCPKKICFFMAQWKRDGTFTVTRLPVNDDQDNQVEQDEGAEQDKEDEEAEQDEEDDQEEI
jgi:uncharacterized protein YfaT (DUF1175 family)